MTRKFTRREFLAAGTVGLGAGLLRWDIRAQEADSPYGEYRASKPPVRPPRPEGDCERTNPDIEGPFYRDGAPIRTELASETEPGRRLQVSGEVLDNDCKPIPGAVLDVWQASSAGRYDNDDRLRPPPRGKFRLRGKMSADQSGRYQFMTVWPGQYDIGEGRRRPSHIHIKVLAPGFQGLTTQMYFQGDPHNPRDSWFDPSRAVNPIEKNGIWVATFCIVLVRS